MKENVLERNARLDTERKIADFRVKQQMDYAFKVKYAKIRAWEFYDHPDVAGSCYVAVGGLDSITLRLFLRSIGIYGPDGVRRRAQAESVDDERVQLHIAGNETQLSIRDFFAAGSFAACAGFAGSGAGNLRRDRARRRRNTQDDKSTENRVLHVRVRRAHGKTPTPVRPAVGAESKGVGNVDESRNAG